MGDVAMLQVAVQRIQQILPRAELAIFTNSPSRLARFCPGARPVNAGAVAAWRSLKVLPLSYKWFGQGAKATVREAETAFRFRWPGAAFSLMRFSTRAAHTDASGAETLWREVRSCTAAVATGGGYFNDSFPLQAEGILDTLRLAQHCGKPFALLGQGLGPLSCARSRRKLARVLRSAQLITLREGRKGPGFLEALRVPAARSIVTGDDALPMAAELAPVELGAALGVNLRVASYSGVSPQDLQDFQALLRELAAQLRAPLLPIPIETKPADSDVAALNQLLPPVLAAQPAVEPESPREVLREIARCRLVITGSYHAGVFALAMGIPVVGLVKSEYYADKFFGLEAQFRRGLAVIQMDQPEAAEKLKRAARELWAAAPELKAPLQESARHQAALGSEAYERFFRRLA